MFRAVALAVLVLSMSVACRPAPRPNLDRPGAARMAGDLPHVGAFDSDARITHASLRDGWFEVDLRTFGRHGWTMNAVFAEMEGDALIEGTESGIVCSGPDENEVLFDEPGEFEIILDPIAIDGVDLLQIELLATVPGRGETRSVMIVSPEELGAGEDATIEPPPEERWLGPW